MLGGCRHGVRNAEADVIAADSVYYARGFRIAYHDAYTDVTIRDPWDTLRTRQRYILVDRNSDIPECLPEGTVIKVPVEKAVIYTSVHAAMIEQLGCLDQVVGVCEPEYITSEEILGRIDAGRIADLGKSTAPNVEKIIDIGTEMIIASPFENSGYGSAEKLGIPIVEAADYMEEHPLGRTEWVRFYGLLFDRRAEADSIFAVTVDSYNSLKRLASEAESRPRVLLERKYGSAWFVPGGKSYIGIIHEDAGGDYIFKRFATAGSNPLSFESVLEEAADADIWLFKYDAPKPYTYDDLEKEYPQYASFAPFRNKKIYACNTIKTAYYDDITLHPDRILADLIFIYHPELLPDHEPRYYLPL